MNVTGNCDARHTPLNIILSWTVSDMSCMIISYVIVTVFVKISTVLLQVTIKKCIDAKFCKHGISDNILTLTNAMTWEMVTQN